MKRPATVIQNLYDHGFKEGYAKGIADAAKVLENEAALEPTKAYTYKRMMSIAESIKALSWGSR